MSLMSRQLVAVGVGSLSLLGIALPGHAFDDRIVSREQRVAVACKAAADGSFVSVKTTVNEPVFHVQMANQPLDQYSEADGLPLIKWTQTLPSRQANASYSPESRCRTVSAHLTNAIFGMSIKDDAQLKALADTSKLGNIYGQGVITGSRYRPESTFFTLAPNNQRKPVATLDKFQNGLQSIGGPDLPAAVMPPVLE